MGFSYYGPQKKVNKDKKIALSLPFMIRNKQLFCNIFSCHRNIHLKLRKAICFLNNHKFDEKIVCC